MSDPRARARGTTRVVGVMGWPVAHSLSPALHNAAFAALDLDWTYVALPVAPGRVSQAVAGLRALGFVGANVTMPHKTEVADLLDDLSDNARRLQAVNTIVAGPDGLAGHNTDAPGFDRFVQRDAGFDPAGRRALLFGAGGAARACALALARGGLEHLTVALRDPNRAEPLRRTVNGFDTEVAVVEFERASTTPADLIVNATPLGARGEALPLPALGPDVLAVDLLYRPRETPFQAAAKAAGGSAFGGLGLLLEQAALSFELWTAQPAPLDVMSAAALAELADDLGDSRTESEGSVPDTPK
ncbi:MAG TPA: shikimate dehydrogenase [Actinomycetota bacterium]|nr:shikimate dehydrogenase [Actinomycetota bacterium]